ncbi:MAG: hypothetical protein IJY84_03095 [Clostridia bacterium]|nr:hypothetical protein [Clostridia bacterium]
MSEERNLAQEGKEVDTFSAKCPNCGSAMVFDADSQSLKCEHCGTTGEIEKDFEVIENDIALGFAQAETWGQDEQSTYKCDNCGAVVVISADEEAKKCPFCQTTHVVKDGSFKTIRPHMVIPFQFGAEKASEYSKKWAKSRLFAPSKFKKSLNVENLVGVYEPCFTFDSNTNSHYVGRVGDRRTRVVGSGKNRRTETYIVYRNVSGTHASFFNDVMIASNSKFTQTELNSLAPFDTAQACVYEKKYLSGYVADGYQVNLDYCWNGAKRVIDDEIRSQIRSRLHCDVVDYLNVTTTHSNVTYKYLLLPVYTLVYKYNKKEYPVRINGSTGKVKGKTPVSAIRVIIAILLGLGLIALVIWLFWYLNL